MITHRIAELDIPVDHCYNHSMKRVFSFNAQMARLNRTFDIFLKRRIQHELLIVRPEMRKIKEVIKAKLGIDIDTKS